MELVHCLVCLSISELCSHYTFSWRDCQPVLVVSHLSKCLQSPSRVALLIEHSTSHHIAIVCICHYKVLTCCWQVMVLVSFLLCFRKWLVGDLCVVDLQSVTLQDSQTCMYQDLGTQFFLRPQDVKESKNRFA